MLRFKFRMYFVCTNDINNRRYLSAVNVLLKFSTINLKSKLLICTAKNIVKKMTFLPGIYVK